MLMVNRRDTWKWVDPDKGDYSVAQPLLQPYNRQTSWLLTKITNQMRKETISIQKFVGEARQASNDAMKAVKDMDMGWFTGLLIGL
ncbi:hypothetical protein M8C21_014056 [Ambrosia artemisiifolia]|uniref:Uncharacterized protein n=1 Tax=Ambrosia artemisiifolia TaxID=4212 RepID=A0AAD5C0R1_AMBAR|nr:hypothetical protein M8C21_014056 [Ambrosia artemisiifolia]